MTARGGAAISEAVAAQANLISSTAGEKWSSLWQQAGEEGFAHGENCPWTSQLASSTSRQSALASRIWSGVRQRALRSSGLQTRMTSP